MKMTEQEALRRKILFRILGGLIAVFGITLIVYIVTLTRYRRPSQDTDMRVVDASENTPAVVTEVATADDAVIESIQNPTEQVIPDIIKVETEDTPVEISDETSEEPSEEISENIPDDSEINIPATVREQVAMNWSDEMESADNVYLSDTTYVAVTKGSINNEPYWLFHVIMADPSQMTTTMTSNPRNRTSAYRLNEKKPYVLALPGSDMIGGYLAMCDGVHVYNGELQGDRSETLGTEVLFTNVGYMSRAEAGLSYEEINVPGLSWTISTEYPTLIDNGVTLDIPDSFANNRSCKTAMGMVKPCEYYFLACSDGDYICDISYADMRDILADKGCFFAQAMHTEANAFIAMHGDIINDPAVEYGRPQIEYIIITDNVD